MLYEVKIGHENTPGICRLYPYMSVSHSGHLRLKRRKYSVVNNFKYFFNYKTRSSAIREAGIQLKSRDFSQYI